MTSRRLAAILFLIFGLLGASICAADQSQDLYASGYELLQSGKSSAAAAKFEAGLKIGPDDALARFYLGESYLALGRSEEAKTQFQRSLKLNPTSSVADDAKVRLVDIKVRAAAVARKRAEEAELVERQAQEAQERAREAQKAAEIAQQSTFTFTNQCGELIWIAMLYQPVDQSDWKVSGWYELQADSAITPSIVVSANSNVYWYAYSSTGKLWSATGEAGSVKAEIVRGPAFSVTHSTAATNLETADFHLYPNGATAGGHSHTLTCAQ
jgi:tetratricopeptide (TPR) repeat protein